MTTKAHTDITVGAPANAAVINAPLGQIDSALADLASVLGDYVVTGGLAGTSASLVLTQPALRAFIQNTYVVQSATTLTATASKDNYIDLDSAGVYHISVVNNGAAAPAVFALSIRLYKAVASATAVTSVVDLRAGPNLVAQSVSTQAAPFSPYAPNAPTGGQATGGNVYIGGPNPWIDVKAPSVTIGVTTYTLGAKGDGVTDDTTPLNNAETAAAVNGATINYPSGTYIISNQIVINGANITHRGASRFAAVIKRANTINQHMVHCTSAANAEFLDLGFDENGANNITIPHAIWMGTNSSGVVIERCRFFNCDGFAIFTQETPGNFVDNLRVIDCDFVQNTTGHWDLFAIATTGGIVSGNRFTVGGTNAGLSIYEANDTPVVDNVIYGQSTGAKLVVIASVLGCTFTANCIIATLNDIAIWLICEQDNANNRNCVDVVISANIIRGVASAYGIFINGGSHANLSVLNTTISDNIFDGTGIGVYVFLGTVTGLSIHQNRFTSSTGVQYAGGTISGVRVDHNDFTGTGTVVSRVVTPTDEIWDHNRGYNPLTVTTPAVSTPLTNNNFVDIYVSFIANAAGTTFTVNGKAFAATPANAQGGFYWPAGTVISYVNAPASWAWIGT